jgi:hypothetical protein
LGASTQSWIKYAKASAQGLTKYTNTFLFTKHAKYAQSTLTLFLKKATAEFTHYMSVSFHDKGAAAFHGVIEGIGFHGAMAAVAVGLGVGVDFWLAGAGAGAVCCTGAGAGVGVTVFVVLF